MVSHDIQTPCIEMRTPIQIKNSFTPDIPVPPRIPRQLTISRRPRSIMYSRPRLIYDCLISTAETCSVGCSEDAGLNKNRLGC